MTRRSAIRGRADVQPLYTGLRVRNLERSVRFYRKLGFRQTIRMKTALGESAQLEHPSSGFTIELNYFPRASRVYEPIRRGTELDHFGFEVDDVDAWAKKLCRAGGKVKMKPFNAKIVIHGKPTFDGRAAYVADPDGIWIELMGPLHSKQR